MTLGEKKIIKKWTNHLTLGNLKSQVKSLFHVMTISNMPSTFIEIGAPDNEERVYYRCASVREVVFLLDELPFSHITIMHPTVKRYIL